MNRLNVLISSISRKIPLIHAVRKALIRFEVPTFLVGGDSNPNCIGSYFVDAFLEIPQQDKLTPERFISLCQLHQINAVIPTRDGELGFFSENQARFGEEGISVMISPRDVLKVVSDKLQFFKVTAKMGYSPIATSENIDDLPSDAYVVKERYGAGSRKIGIGLSHDQAIKHAKQLSQPLFQPFIEGSELSIDFYIDKKGKGKGVIVRTRDLVIDGESQITTSVKNEQLEIMALSLAEDLGIYGHGMFQVIQDSKGSYHIIECNPRFGGASTLSVEMGLDSFYWFFKEVMGSDLSEERFDRFPKERRMVRYPEDLFFEEV
jgi:carbamoyl-phosphate synthase large subunit